MNSCLYFGDVLHRRLRPVRHEFRYAVCYLFLDLDEVQHLFRFPFLLSYNFPGLLSFWRKDYLGDRSRPLKESVRAEIRRQTGDDQRGPVRLLTTVSFLGYCFNPVSFYYCYAEDGKTLTHVVAEVTNTPWLERHRHVVRYQGDKHVYEQTKEFHVSPFMPMEIDYKWVLPAPSERAFVLMQNRYTGEDALLFDAKMELSRAPWTLGHLLRAWMRFPLMSFGPTLGIYWQAIHLWRKKVPFHTHPAKKEKSA